SATLLALLSDPTGALADVLRHHIVNGDYLRADFGPDQKVRTLLGDSLQVTNTMDSFLVDGVLITVSDVVATNGVVQVIDAVLLPVMVEDTFTILDAVKASPVHKTLDSLLQLSGLDVQLDGVGPYTLFAPTDEAFAALPTAVMDSLAADPQGLLRDVLLYHILSGEFRT
ncbi:MAG: fasciclin domain-containing protein, partial [Candidatus Competibacteraceae bacterium]|nr:fasciclin domain-containing protein [Candidatus Competibacteraceae bacterium]